MAAVRIDDKAFADARFALLAKLMKLPEPDFAIIKVARIWQMQTENYTPQRPTYVVHRDVVAAMLGPKGADYLRMAGLAEDDEEGLYMKGTKGRIEWLYTKRASASTAGIASGYARRAKSYREQTFNERSTSVQRTLNESSTDAQRMLNENPTHANALTLSLSPSLSKSSYELSERERESTERETAPASPAPKTPASRKKPARQLPADWQPTEAHGELAREHRVDLAAEAVKFRDWAASKAEVKADWDAAFRNWLRSSRPMLLRGGPAPRDIRFGSAPPNDFEGVAPGEHAL